MPAQAVLDEVICPRVFSIAENLGGVIDVIKKIRSNIDDREKHIFIDFKSIETFDFSAALVLVAELYRANVILDTNLSTLDIREWNSEFRYRLHGLGFFDLMKVSYPERLESRDRRNVKDYIRFLKYRTGGKSDVVAVKNFIDKDISRLVGGKAPLSEKLAAAITEAMLNSNSHAYVTGNLCPNWWLSGAFDSRNNTLSVQIYDQGAGIPETLQTKLGEKLGAVLSALGLSATPNHAQLIKAAHDLNRSGVLARYRGNGLPRDIRGYWDDVKLDGHYRVLSRRGEYKITRSGGNQTVDLIDSGSDLRGTLIEWRLKID